VALGLQSDSGEQDNTSAIVVSFVTRAEPGAGKVHSGTLQLSPRSSAMSAVRISSDGPGLS
jgi:hypothetical protein